MTTEPVHVTTLQVAEPAMLTRLRHALRQAGLDDARLGVELVETSEAMRVVLEGPVEPDLDRLAILAAALRSTGPSPRRIEVTTVRSGTAHAR